MFQKRNFLVFYWYKHLTELARLGKAVQLGFSIEMWHSENCRFPVQTVNPPQATRYVIPVVRSTFQVINELATSGSLTLNEVARRTGVPKSTAFRILVTLLSLGVALRDPEQKTYRLGRALRELSRENESLEALRRIALPHMLELRNMFGETVNLGELQHDTVVYVDVVPSEYALKLSERPGATVWGLSTALGRSILAFSPAVLVETLLQARELPALTPFTITDPVKLRKELKRVRLRGYAIEHEESALQATCIGVPILNDNGEAIAAISISGPTHRFQPAQDKRIAEVLVKVSVRIGQEFQG